MLQFAIEFDEQLGQPFSGLPGQSLGLPGGIDCSRISDARWIITRDPALLVLAVRPLKTGSHEAEGVAPDVEHVYEQSHEQDAPPVTF